MTTTKNFLLGCNGRGAMHQQEPSIEEQFRLVHETEAFDYFDRLPQPDQIDEYLRYSEKYRLPMHTASWFYLLGRDEPLLDRNLRTASEIGAKAHNIMVFTRDHRGYVVSDDAIASFYLNCWDKALRLGIRPSFELHVNMWSEDFRRVAVVTDKVRKHGIPFCFTLDYSHVNFKIENPEEQDISGIREDVESGRLSLDPFEDGSLCDTWLESGIVLWAQMRPAAPNGPKNLWAFDEFGNPGRGIQYPFIKPRPEEWHSPWHAYKVEPTKQAMRKVMRYHLTNPSSPLEYVTTEMINLTDYGMNAKYSLIEQNAACARWIRATWEDMKARHACGLPLTLT